MRKIKTTAGINKYHWDYREFCYLVKVLSQTNDFKEILNLFIDMHTTQEISEIIRRVIITSMLSDGKTYLEISELTGSSPATISKIQSKLNRQKSVLAEMIQKSGTFEKFLAKSINEKDGLTSMIDQMLSKRSLGIFGKK